jgi:sialidase-1
VRTGCAPVRLTDAVVSMKRWLHALVVLLMIMTGLLLGAGRSAAGGVPPAGDVPSGGVAGQLALFRSGTSGYGCFRIPALVRTRAGSLLAFAEGRKSPSCPDRGDNDLVVRRSTNDGRTWGPIQVIPAGTVAPDAYGAGPVPPGTVNGSAVTRGSMSPVVDMSSGRIHLLSTSDPVDSSSPRVPWSQFSTDDGKTWSEPEKLTVTLRGTGIGTDFFTTGPGHGIQLTEGAHKKRLIVTANQIAGTAVNGGYLYLDPAADGSGTWKAADTVDSTVGTASTGGPTEIATAEADGGNVQLIARNTIPATRTAALSVTPADSGTPAVPAFTGAGIPSYGDVEGALLRLHAKATDGTEQLLLAAPAGPSRTNMTIWSRCGTGATAAWGTQPLLVSGGRVGYSDLALLLSNEIGVLYEGGADSTADGIRFAHIDERALNNPCKLTERPPNNVQQAPEPLPTSPDVSGEANDAYLTGAATLGSGNLSSYLDRSLSLTGGYADVPYSRSVRPSAGDFTFSLWFRHQATAGTTDYMLFSAYGDGAGRPQVSLRLRPGGNDLLAAATATDGTTPSTVSVASAPDPGNAAYADGSWHHATLIRSGGTLSLGVDDTAPGTATGLNGTVTVGPDRGPLGIRIGAENGTHADLPFAGDIDEFRLYRTALTPDQVTRLGTEASSSDPLGGAADAALTVRLPFQVVDGATVPARTDVAGVYDESGHCTDAWAMGGRGQSVSRTGSQQGLVFNDDHPGVEAPMTPALQLGTGDFTASLWFSYTPTANHTDQALMWAYGMNSGTPQLWVQAQPSANRLLATVETDGGPVQVNVPDPDGTAFSGEQVWHQMVLIRSGDRVTLMVDNKTPPLSGTATGLTGSLTPHPTEPISGLRIGARVDGGKVLNGAVDEFRLYPSALSPAALTTVHHNGGLGPNSGLAVRYSFDNKYTYAAHDVRPAARDSLATPDTSGRCNHAFLLGGARVTADPQDGTGSLHLTGDGGLLVPRNASLAVPADQPDFTLAMSFRYAATTTTPDQVLFWGYGTGPTARQLWLRLSPTTDSLSGAMATDTGQARITGTGTSAAPAYGDGDWHSLALVRHGTSLLLSVDGAQIGSTTLAPGALTTTDNFAADGLRFGSKPDGTQGFTGSLDTIRLFHRALTPEQLSALDTGTVPDGLRQDLFLPFDIEADQSYPIM